MPDVESPNWTAVDWSKVELSYVQEILRQAELRMELTDRSYQQGRQRALDFVRTFVTLATLLVGVAFAADLGPALRGAASGGALAFFVAILLASPAVFPGYFCIAGVHARYWIPELVDQKAMTLALGEQVESLDQQQAANDAVVSKMATRLKRALYVTASAPIAAALAGFAADFTSSWAEAEAAVRMGAAPL